MSRPVYIKRPHLHRLMLAAVVVLFTIPAGRSEAARSGSGQIQLLRLSRWTGNLSMEAGIADYKVDRDGRIREESRNLFAPGLQLANRGFIYHPRLVTFNVSGDLAWSRLRESENFTGFDQRTNSWLNSYSMRFAFLQKRRFHFDFQQDRQHSRVRVTDTRNTNVLDRKQVLSAFWRQGTIPVEFRRETGVRSTTGLISSKETRNVSRILSRYAKSRTHVGEVSLRRSRIENKDYDYFNTRYEAHVDERFIRPNWMGGARLRWWRLDTQNDRTESTRGSVSARRDLIYGFRTSGNIEAERYRGSATREDRIDGRASLAHQLYSSLDTELSLQLARSTPVDGRLRTIDGRFETRYRKRIPYGRLNIAGSIRRLDRDTNADDVEVTVVELVIRFGQADDFLFEEADIITGSVSLLDSTGTIVYAPGSDYEVVQIGRATFLRRRSDGRIAPDASVRVNYRYLAGMDVREVSNIVTGSSRITTDVGLYAKIVKSRRRPIDPTSEERIGLIESTNQTVGAGLRRKSWGADWEEARYDGEPIPWKRTRIVGRLSGGIFRRLRWSARADRGWNEFPDQGDRFDFGGAEASLTANYYFGRTTLTGRFNRQETESGEVERWRAGFITVLRLRVGQITLEGFEGEIHSEATGGERDRSLVLRIDRRIP